MNQSLKNTVFNTCAETDLKKTDALTITLMHTKQRPKQIGLMPAGVLFGRYFQIPNTYVAAKTVLLGGDERLTQYVLEIHKYIKF